MAVATKHRGWLYSPNNAILAGVLNGAGVNTPSVLATNTALDGVLLGTPVTPALALDSLVLSNLVASGDILIAANNGGNSQAWLWVDASAGTMTLYGAGTAFAIISATSMTVADDQLLRLGTTGDIVLLNRSATHTANTVITNVLLGTPVTPALPANSLIISNVTASGDVLIVTNLSGNSQAWLWIDTSASLLTLLAAGVSSVEHGATGVVFNEASADRDFRIESNDNANMFVLDAGSNVIGIGGAVVANQTVTITNTAIAATGRILKLAGTIAAAALTDGYGAFEVDITLSGSPTDHTAAASAWVNITGGTVPPGTYICARNDGIYEESAATVTNAKLIFGARMQYICSDTDGLRFPWSINTNNAAITALIDVNNLTDLGTVANAGASAATLLPICRDAAGVLKYVLLYDLT